MPSINRLGYPTVLEWENELCLHFLECRIVLCHVPPASDDGLPITAHLTMTRKLRTTSRSARTSKHLLDVWLY